MSCCLTPLMNTGAGCSAILKDSRQLFFVKKYKTDGSRNYLDLSASLTTAIFTALINKADVNERVYPSLLLEFDTPENGEAISVDLGQERSLKLADGIRKESVQMVGEKASNILAGEMKKLECGEWSAYVVDRDGSIRGMFDGTDKTKLYPISIDEGSMSVTFLNQNLTTPTAQSIKLDFSWSRSEAIEDVRVVDVSEMTNSPLGLKGLFTVTGVVTAISTTGYTLQLITQYGSMLTPVYVAGMVTTDLTLSQISPTIAAVAGTLVVENAALNNYAVTFTAETTADVLKQVIVMEGYDFSLVESDATITIP